MTKSPIATAHKASLSDNGPGQSPFGDRTAPISTGSANSDLVGSENARQNLSTPALVLDLDAFERNVKRMADIAMTAGLALRPHAKSHKCSEIAKRQISAGAVGVCCATLEEAETMVAAGVPGVHVTSPATGTRKVQQLISLAQRAPDLMVVIDHVENARDIAKAAEAAGQCINVLIDIDPEMNRTGVVTTGELLALAQIADDAPALQYRGIQCYEGILQHFEDAKERRAAVEHNGKRLAAMIAELTKAGLEPAIVSGAGTGSAQMESAEIFTELQAGSYVVMDVEYARVRTDGTHTLPFEPALFISSTVLNSHRNGQSTIDAGTKAVARGWSMPILTNPADTGIAYEFSGDEHGRLVYPGKTNTQLPPGSRVELFIPHCDPNVDLYAYFHCMRGDKLVDIWPIDARSNR